MAEAMVSKAIQCQFESDGGYAWLSIPTAEKDGLNPSQ